MVSKGNTNLFMVVMKTCKVTLWKFIKNLRINLPQDLAMPVLRN